MNVGIDRLAFYTPNFYLNLTDLAKAQGKPEDTYLTGTGQNKMAIPAPNEDIVTMGAHAAERVVSPEDKDQINLLLFATESGTDQSKAAGMYLHQLLNLSPNCRVVELKQACYGATAGLQLAMSYLRYTEAKVLLVASDVARYDSHTPAESSQGAGAAALLLARHPRIMTIEESAGYYALDAMDFWRPNYRREALVDGRLSCDLYLKGLKESWIHYQSQCQRTFSDHTGFCYHVPVPRLAEKAHQRLAKLSGLRLSNEETSEWMKPALSYSKEIGNSYTASLYISLLSWLNHYDKDPAYQRVGLYSYGSGCTAEYFSGVVQPHYRQQLDPTYDDNLLKQRTPLSYSEYQDFFKFSYPQDGSCLKCSDYPGGRFVIERFDQHQRIYKKINR